MDKVLDFFKRHLIITNLLIMVVVTLIILWGVQMFLGWWTRHGEEQVVPDLRNMSLADATATLHACGLQIEVSDSVYNDDAKPGYVIEQNSSPGSVIKADGTVAVTINAYNRPLVQIPALSGISLRQAQATLSSLGFPDVEIERVPSDYKDLVISVRAMGVNLRPGTRLPLGTPVVLEVGEGIVEPEPDSIGEYTELPAEEWTDIYE